MKIKALLLMLFLMFISTNALAIDWIQGRIVGDDNAGINVELYLDGGCGGDELVDTTTTNAQGHFAFENLDNDSYSVIVLPRSGYTYNRESHDVTIPQDPLSYYTLRSTKLCGNGEIDSGEECDDGNVVDGDWCSSSCFFNGGKCEILTEPWPPGDTVHRESGCEGDAMLQGDVIGEGFSFSYNKYEDFFDEYFCSGDLMNEDTCSFVNGTWTPYTPTCANGGASFEDNGDGTVTDCTTDLVWLKDANCYDKQDWNNSVSSAAGLNSGECGLTDGSVEGDWRLATKEELQGIGLNETGTWTKPGLPFENVLGDNSPFYFYWSSTEDGSTDVWTIAMYNGNAYLRAKDADPGLAWPVRSAN